MTFHKTLTSRKEQVAMSRMMQPRDQMSDLQVKENLRVSGAIQDLWQGSVGKIKVEEPLSPLFPGDRETEQSKPASALPLPFWVF